MGSNSAGNRVKRAPRDNARRPRDRKGGFLVSDLAVYLHTQTWKIRAVADSSGVALRTVPAVAPRASQFRHYLPMTPAEAAAVVDEFRRQSYNTDP